MNSALYLLSRAFSIADNYWSEIQRFFSSDFCFCMFIFPGILSSLSQSSSLGIHPRPTPISRLSFSSRYIFSLFKTLLRMFLLKTFSFYPTIILPLFLLSLAATAQFWPESPSFLVARHLILNNHMIIWMIWMITLVTLLINYEHDHDDDSW